MCRLRYCTRAVEIESPADRPGGRDAGRRERAGLVLGLIEMHGVGRHLGLAWICTAEMPSVAASSTFSLCQKEYP